MTKKNNEVLIFGGTTLRFFDAPKGTFFAVAMILATNTYGQVPELQSNEQLVEEPVDVSSESSFQAAPAAPSNRDSDSEKAPIEEVIVTIQRSLETALEEKRRSTNLIEVINAEDVGKLPDENIAEVLENLPGVQIERSAGIGSGVSIRGSSQNRVEINGRGTTPSGDQRGGISFTDLPAALVRSLTVVKVPTADMVEGSVGGTIDVKTYRGLRLREPLRVFSLKSEYASNAEKWNDSLSTTWGNKFETGVGDIGVIATFSSVNKKVREDSLRVSPASRGATFFNSEPGSKCDFDLSEQANCAIVPSGTGAGDSYFYPGFSDTIYTQQDRSNTAFSGSIEWQATDELKVFFEGTYTDFERFGNVQSAFASYGPNGGDGAAETNRDSDREIDGLPNASFRFINVAGATVPIQTSGVIAGGLLNDGIDGIDERGPSTGADGLRIRTNGAIDSRSTESYVTALGGEWSNDEWLVEFELSEAGSDSREIAFRTTMQFNDPALSASEFTSESGFLRVPFFYDTRDGNLAFGPLAGTPNADFLLNPDYYALAFIRDTEREFDNNESTQKLDVTWQVDKGYFTDLKWGLRWSQRSNERVVFTQSSDSFPDAFSPGSNEKAFVDGLLTDTPGDFFSFNSDGTYFNNFLTVNPESIEGLRPELRTLVGLESSAPLNAPQGFLVDEDTFATYFRSDFYDEELLGFPIGGNVGLRMVHTDQYSEGSEIREDGLYTVWFRQKYTNWLPSASLVIQPVEKIQVRLGYAEILRRPNFSQLSPTAQFPLNTEQAVTVGNPELRPTTADQYDLVFEYYWRKGSVISLGYYYKDLESVISREPLDDPGCNPVAISDAGFDCSTTGSGDPADFNGYEVDQIQSINRPGGTIKGFELAIQHNFNWLPRPYNGLGVIANYAYQDGDRQDSFTPSQFLRDNGAPLEAPLNFRQLSEESYNLTLYFERPRYRLSGRIRYTYRDGFLITESSDVANTQPLYADDRSQLNASMSYRIDDVFRLTFSGVNLTKQKIKQRASFADGPLVRQLDSDRRISFGIRARF